MKTTLSLRAMVFPAAEIAGRNVFYNNSAFDGNDLTANQQDDNAIAPDKQALLPGQTATFANYTSFSQGINGIMIDIIGMPDGAEPSAKDFEFRIGRSEDLGSWYPVAAPPKISLRENDGVDGSDRVTVVWPDYAIANQWLEVTVLDTGITGLAEPDVFYYGNAVGESGNSPADARVNAVDVLLARNDPHNSLNEAPLASNIDYNRDKRVNATDMLIARNNQTHFLNALKLITVPGSKHAELEEAAVGESASREASSAKMDWLYEWELTDTLKRPAKKDTSAKEAVSGLFTRDPLL